MAAHVLEHGRGDGPGIGALALPEGILAGEADIGAGQFLGHRGQGGKGRGQGHLGLKPPGQSPAHFPGQGPGLFQGLVHLPVGRDEIATCCSLSSSLRMVKNLRAFCKRVVNGGIKQLTPPPP